MDGGRIGDTKSGKPECGGQKKVDGRKRGGNDARIAFGAATVDALQPPSSNAFVVFISPSAFMPSSIMPASTLAVGWKTTAAPIAP